MDSVGLAKAITSYWSQTFAAPNESNAPGNELPMISIAGIHRRIKRALSSRSARAWLLKLGWNWKEVKKGVYRDGHERQDITEYHEKIFLPRMQSLQPLMIEWDQNLEVIPEPQVLGIRPIVFITYDECTFNSNDGSRKNLDPRGQCTN